MRDWLHLLGRLPNNNDNQKWFESDVGDNRLAHDRKILKEKYPDLKYLLNWKFRKALLSGTITLVEEKSGIPSTVKVRVIFPNNYPESEPLAVDGGNQFSYIADRHFYKTGVCCLWLPLESQWEKNDENTLLNFVDHVAIFYERQLIYDATGNKIWAWGERGHGVEGYIECLEEKLECDQATLETFLPLLTNEMNIHDKSKCLCGSRQNYGKCHKKKVEEVKKLFGS